MPKQALMAGAWTVPIYEGMNLLHAGPVWVWALIAGVVISVVVVSGSFATIARIFKYLCISLLTYVVVLFVARVEWSKVVTNTLVPHVQLTPAYLGLLVGVLGTTLSPYLFFWQTAHRGGCPLVCVSDRGGWSSQVSGSRPGKKSSIWLRASRQCQVELDVLPKRCPLLRLRTPR